MERFEKCLYCNVCDYDMKICNENCNRYRRMTRMMNEGNIPKQMQKINPLTPYKIDVPSFDILANIRNDVGKFVNGGFQLYLWSYNCGNGKTAWSVKILLQYLDLMWENTIFRTRGVFVNIPWFMYKCKDIITNPDNEFEEFKQKLFDADLVVWDDIGTKDLSGYENNLLYVILNKRIENEKANIYTGNISLQELEEVIDKRIASRLYQNCIELELKGKGMRGENGAITNFIKSPCD